MADYICKKDSLNAIKTAELGQEYEIIEAMPSISIRFLDKDHVWIDNKQFVSISCLEGGKTGKWVSFALSNSLNEQAAMIVCSNCRSTAPYVTAYCPWCGSKNV